MSVTVDHLTGFEHGIMSLAGMSPAFAGLTISTATPRNGTYFARCAPTGAAAGNWRWNTVQTATTRRVTRFGFRLTTPPASGTANIWYLHLSTTFRAGIRVDNNGLLSASLDGTNWTNGATISDTAWHYIEAILDYSAANNSLLWRVDGADQTTVGPTAAATTSPSIQTLGTLSTAGPAATLDFDDFITGICTTTSDWFGDGKVIALRPASDGTHSMTANDFTFGDAGANITNSTTNVNSVLSADPWSTSRDATNEIRQAVLRTTSYCEVACATTPETGNAVAVMAWLSRTSTGTQSNSGACIVRNSAGTRGIVYGDLPVAQGGGGTGLADYSDAAPVFTNVVVPNPGTWTPTEVNAIRFRFGGSGDVTPFPCWQDMLLELAYPVAAGALNLTAATGTATAAGSANALSLAVVSAAGAATTAGTVALAIGISAASGAATANGGASALTAAVGLTAASGTATAGGGTVVAFQGINLVASGGSAAASGSTSTLSFQLGASTGTATAGGSASVLTQRYSAAAGTATAGGAASTATVVLAASSGTSAASGGTVNFVAGALALSATGGTATAGGGSVVETTGNVLSATDGLATGSGGTITLRATYTAASGTAVATGGTVAITETRAVTGGVATASGTASALTIGYAASAGAASASGGSVVTGALIVTSGLATAGGGSITWSAAYSVTVGQALANGGIVEFSGPPLVEPPRCPRDGSTLRYTDPMGQVRCTVCFLVLNDYPPGEPIGRMQDTEAPLVAAGHTYDHPYSPRFDRFGTFGPLGRRR